MNGEYKNEEWRAVPGYENNYMVSNMGRVKNIKLNHILKPVKVIGGYYRVDLSVNNNPKHFRVHKLVALAFLPNPKNLPSINHKDENKANNSVDNLEWCTHKYNSNYGTAKERSAAHKNYAEIARKGLVYKYKPVVQYNLNGEFVKRWESATHCEKVLGINASRIRSCCRGVSKIAHGYIWRYENGQ